MPGQNQDQDVAGSARNDQPAESADSFARDIAPDPATLGPSGHGDESYRAVEDKDIYRLLPDLTAGKLSTLPIVEPGTRLEQGGVYADLNDLARGPFKALGSEFATADVRYIAKRDVDYELWNRLVGQHAEPRIERPPTVGSEQRQQ
jgi:hypothetical protein